MFCYVPISSKSLWLEQKRLILFPYHCNSLGCMLSHILPRTKTNEATHSPSIVPACLAYWQFIGHSSQGWIGLLGLPSQTGWPKQQMCIFFQFLRVEGQDQGVSRLGFLGGLSPWFADGLHPVSSLGLPSVSICALIPSSFKDTDNIGLGSAE